MTEPTSARQAPMDAFRAPSKPEIVEVLRRHPLIRLREDVLNAYLVGSFCTGNQNPQSDVDVLLEVAPRKDLSAADLEERYRQPLRQYFVTNNIRGKDDSIHPQWCGRRVDVYFTYDASEETRPKALLDARRPSEAARAEPDKSPQIAADAAGIRPRG